MGSQTVEFRDTTGVYLTCVNKPAFIYDTDTCIWLKYGELSDIKEIYESWVQKYKESGYPEMVRSIAILEVEPDQELIDKLFTSSGNFEAFVRAKKMLNTQFRG